MQSFLVSIVLCSWLIPPNSGLSKESVSAVLLTYVAAGADISEFFSNINEEKVKTDGGLVNAIIGIHK
jgi:hypothetical protein